MHGTLALVCKEWNKIVDCESFRSKVQRRFLDLEFEAEKWPKERIEEFYYSGIQILECFHCGVTFKDRHGYYRDPQSKAVCYYPKTDTVDCYCKDFAFLAIHEENH